MSTVVYSNTLTIDAIAITTASLSGTRRGVAYSEALAAVDGTEPYTWSVSSGVLPSGLSLDADTGVISGTPILVETQVFDITVTDDAAATDTVSLSIEVLAGLIGGTIRVDSVTNSSVVIVSDVAAS